FSSYADGLEAGDLIPSSYTITVNLGYNQTILPDLTGELKAEIESALTDLQISYEFSYIIDDAYPEDSFAGYVDLEVGDYYAEETTVTVNLYKNTFTDDATSLFISKYVDGGDGTSDQAIEIYNPTASAIDLSNYYLAIYINGSRTISYNIPLSDVSLGVDETFVVANASANSTILSKADQTSADLLFDGNDVIQLCYMNGTYIDTIYDIGNRNFILDNEIFIRSEDVVKGTRTFIYNQWNGFIPTYTSVLGTYPITFATDITFEWIDRPFDDPLGGMDEVTCTGVADGDTAYFDPGFLADERVRFLGVDTPETYPVTDPWGPEAKEYTREILLAAENVFIQSDPDLGYTDTYGRHLGLVWVDLGDQVLT
ncbi:MAG TPA: lamin tail domain-containing protein, partial [Bacillota bacterium]|nr:lamin tail domain-containing protein [Bacillota bacterium]